MNRSRSGVEGSQRGDDIRRLSAAVVLLVLGLVALVLAPATASAASSFPGQGVLPENRAWEMVSPPDKNGAGVHVFPGALVRSDGESIAFDARIAFPGAAGANGLVDTYIASRDAQDGWDTSSAIFPYGNAGGTSSTDSRVYDLAPDLSKGIVRLSEGPLSSVPPYAPDAPVDCTATGDVDFCQNAYLFDYPSKQTNLLTPMPTAALGVHLTRGAGSDDYSHYVYWSQQPQLATADLNELYEYELETNTIRLVGIDENGDQFAGDVPIRIAGFAAAESDYFRSSPVSADGDRIYFERQPGAASMKSLYLRDHASDTYRVNESERESPATQAAANFVGASKDGSVAYFHTTESLLDEDTDATADLYRWELSENPATDDNLTLISFDEEPVDGTTGVVNQASQGGLVGIDDEGDIAYFTSNNQLVEDGPTGHERYLYRWTKEGGKEFIAPLLAADAADNWQGISGGNRQRVINSTPDGQHLLMLTRAQLAPEDTDAAADAYRFDANASSAGWICASCVDGVPSAAPVTLRPPGSSQVYTAMGMSDDGARVFFESSDPLKPGDGNGKKDVFMWADGEVHRISGGNAPSNSDFLGTDVNGDNAFLLTDEPLSSWDVDMNLYIYVARVDGGLPEPEIAAGCNGDGCQGDLSGSPASEQIGSDGETAGNPTPKVARDCTQIQRRANKAKQQSRRLARRAKQANSPKKTKRLKRQAKGKKRQARQLERRVTRCQEGSR